MDGLPGLILCSGVVVAAGREPFRPANYSAQKSAPPAMPTSNRASLRRLRSLNRKFGAVLLFLSLCERERACLIYLLSWDEVCAET